MNAVVSFGRLNSSNASFEAIEEVFTREIDSNSSSSSLNGSRGAHRQVERFLRVRSLFTLLAFCCSIVHKAAEQCALVGIGENVMRVSFHFLYGVGASSPV